MTAHLKVNWQKCLFNRSYLLMKLFNFIGKILLIVEEKMDLKQRMVQISRVLKFLQALSRSLSRSLRYSLSQYKLKYSLWKLKNNSQLKPKKRKRTYQRKLNLSSSLKIMINIMRQLTKLRSYLIMTSLKNLEIMLLKRVDQALFQL
jgi:hypothetical protein